MSNLKRCQISIIALLMIVCYSGAIFAEEDTAVLSATIGTVETCPSGTDTWKEVEAGIVLYAGDKIKTGADGMASILFTNGSEVTLKQNTEFEIDSLRISDDKKDVNYTLKLSLGKLRAVVGELSDNSSFEIKAPTAVAAVRGTTFYLNVSEVTADELPPGVEERLKTELFVEVGGVIYTNTLSGKYYAVSAGETSGSYGDGSVTVPLEIPEDLLQEWLQGWDDILAAEPYQDPDGGDPDLGGTGGGGGDDGTGGDRQSDQLGQLLKEIHEQDELNIIWREMCDKLIELEHRDELYEQIFLRTAVKEILEGNRERRLEGYIEKISDAQMAKVLTDVHGNRVRVEQYVLRPQDDVVEILNINLRGNTSGGDLTTMEWTTKFNESLDGLPTGGLKDLPWDYYLETQYVGDILEYIEYMPGIPDEVIEEIEDMTIGEILSYMEGDIPDGIAEILDEIEDMPITDFEDMPIFIFSPSLLDDIYPEEMCVKFSHNDDAFAESRVFSERFSFDDFYYDGYEFAVMGDNGFDGDVPEWGIQIIEMQSLSVNGFNSDKPMLYLPALPEIGQLPGTYSIERDLRNATIGGAENNPMGFQYNFVSSAGVLGDINAAFYVVSDSGARQDGYGDDGPDSIWDVLGVNMEDDDMWYDVYGMPYVDNGVKDDDGYLGDNDIGDNNVEMVFNSSLFTSGPIDLIYIPLPNMDWQEDDYIPFPGEGEEEPPTRFLD